MDLDEMAGCFSGTVPCQDGGFAEFHRRNFLCLVQDKLTARLNTAGGLKAFITA